MMLCRLYRSARLVLWVFLLLLLDPMQFRVLPMNAQVARLLPAIAITEGKTAEGYPYLFGGISSNEREVMEARANDYNLKLVFTAKSGAYISGVTVILATAQGAEIISVGTEGPWFYIRLPRGIYSVKASFAGKTKQIRNVRVSTDRLTEQIFSWDLSEQLEQ